MSFCLNPICPAPQNPSHLDICQTCGFALRLKNRYRAIKVIGRGGFGRTLLAVDEAQPLKPCCVIKQFLPQPENLANTEKAFDLFKEEVLRLRDVGKHPNIPDLFGYCSQQGYQYLIQEFIDGRDLAQELTEDGAFSELKIRQLLEELLPVVQFIHDLQIIHRDIKPANIIRRQSDQSLFLVDLGAAKQTTGTALAQTGTVIGSAEYVSPEQSHGKAVFASDIYSLGATCIHLLTGMSPFDLYNSHEGLWVWQEYLPQPVSRSLASVLNKMLSDAPSKRYASAIQVSADTSFWDSYDTTSS
ncbi:protein kinase [Leptolyngbyaceae cyanobacterium UHCC 1019]